MSDALVILDSDEEEDQLETSKLDYDDESLFETSAPVKKRDLPQDDDLDVFLNSLKSNTTQLVISDDEVLHSPVDHVAKEKPVKKKGASEYAKYFQDSSPEPSPSPKLAPKVPKRRSLKDPTPSRKKQQEEREDSIKDFIDGFEDIMQQKERENSLDALIEKSQSMLSSSRHKKDGPLDNMPDSKSKIDSMDDIFDIPSHSTRIRKNSVDALLGDDDLSDEMGTTYKEIPSEKKMKRHDLFELEGDYMGRENKITSHKCTSISKKPPPESIDLLSDDDSDHQEDKYTSHRDKPLASSYDDDDKPRKFKPSSRFKSDKLARPRKNSIDMLLDEDIIRSPSPKVMPTRPLAKMSYENLLYGSDSSPETSPTLQPKRAPVNKRKRLSTELSDDDIASSSRTKQKDIPSKPTTTTFNLDDSDNDILGDDVLDITCDNDDNDDGELDTDAFFKDLISIPKKRKTYALESVASSSKPTSVYMDIEDDESIVMDRKGKKRADAIRPPPPRRKDSFDNILNDISQADEDISTPKEKRQLQSEKRKEEAQRKREEKIRLREEKKLEKERQALYEKANKIKSNRNDILKEMIMDVHPSFLISKPGQIIQEVMVSKETEVSPLDDACCQTISWRRKCTAEWDMDSQSFQPLSQTKLVDEPVVLLFFEANRFIQHIVEDTLDGTIRKLKRSCRDKQVMMMMEGLETYYKKRKLLESRQFQQAVRQSINDDNDTRSASSKRKKKTSIYETGPKKEEVEKVLVQLQMVEDIMLIPTKSAADSASWLESLTTDLALGRYKTKNLNNTYRVTRTGKGSSDTFCKMLQEVHLCTPAVAKSVMSTYPSAQSLYQAYQKTSRGSMLLADLEVERSAVQVRDRTINKVMSNKLYSIFTNTDPEYVIF